MKSLSLLLFLAAVSPCVADLPRFPRFESSLQSRVGFDTNPAGTSGTSAAVLGDAATLVYAAGASVGLTWSGISAQAPSLTMAYAGEAVRFERWSGENFTTHRFGFTGQGTLGVWRFTGEGSSLYVAGPSDTLVSVPSVNANAIALWRERRRQWQHRLKLQTQAAFDAWLVRGSGAVLDYDYQTDVVSGKVAFADRTDMQATLELGWRRNPGSLWIAGVRAGRQEQATVPLPNCEFDYSNDYFRLAAGWEGKLFSHTTLTFAFGPDFRHYSGATDARVWQGGHERTSMWFEGGFISKLAPSLSLTGKAARMDWLSSTGKSAYIDTSAEVAGTWLATPVWTLRLAAKVHRCDYLPVVREDWESFFGAGATRKISDRVQVSVDILRHRAWNNLAATSERAFQRCVVSVGATLKL